jgi:hypothetical protein
VWRTWKTASWRGFSNKPVDIFINMYDFPPEETVLRASMDHGDNRPVEIGRFELQYLERAALFVAVAPGPLEVFGGNPEAKAGKYDLELVRGHLSGMRPEKVELGEVVPLNQKGWKLTVLNKIFGENGWGLYVVLIGISLVLIFIIAKLFPKETDRSAEKDPSAS